MGKCGSVSGRETGETLEENITRRGRDTRLGENPERGTDYARTILYLFKAPFAFVKKDAGGEDT